MKKEAIFTDKAPKAVGPYSQAVRMNGLVFLSGQIALDPSTGQLVTGGIQEQTARVLENIKAVLEGAGLGFDDVVKTSVFLKNMDDFTAMNETYAKYFGATPPARSTIQAAKLPRDVQVEIDAIAAEPKS